MEIRVVFQFPLEYALLNEVIHKSGYVGVCDALLAGLPNWLITFVHSFTFNKKLTISVWYLGFTKSKDQQNKGLPELCK